MTMKMFEVIVTDGEYQLLKKCLKYERLVLDNKMRFQHFVHDVLMDGLRVWYEKNGLDFPSCGGVDYEPKCK